MNKQFKNVGAAHPGRSMFNLSYEKKLTCDFGELIPVMCDFAMPGDIWKIASQLILRFTPLVAPILHQVDVYFHYFFVPERICFNSENFPQDYGSYEDYITGGPAGNDNTPPVTIGCNFAKGSIGDYFGLPIGDFSAIQENNVNALPFIAYAEIWNNYYRDETLQTELNNTNFDWNTVLLRNWEKDYFTSASLTQQRGTSPAIPFTGNAEWAAAEIINGAGNVNLQASSVASVYHLYINDANGRNNIEEFLNNNTLNLTPLDINDLRESFQIQRFLERNMRAGVRYPEFLNAHFGVHPRDDRLQRPEYIGGCKCPVIISEVLQTSKTDGTAYQGTMTGHGIALNQEYISKYHVQEFGWILGIMSIMPKPAYQQGIDRQWLYKSKYDYPFPEFAHISEQAILTQEIYAMNDAHTLDVFGFCGAYDELRTKKNLICGNFRDTYDYWHISRQFGNQPQLNSSFITCVPRKDCFAVQNEDCCLVQVGNILNVLRPMPIIAEPGLIDHG